jgi:hypothetical protein
VKQQGTKVISMAKQPKVNDLIDQIKTRKRTFIPPKQKMKESIENDANYLMALGAFIEEAQKEMVVMSSQKKMYKAAKIQIEIFDAIGKFQANEGIVHDKQLHYEKVFLPMYEKELVESKENFEKIKGECEIIAQKQSDNADELKMINFIKNELEIFNDSEMLNDEEYQLHTYKILKRLHNKHKEIIAVDNMAKK